MNARIRGTQQDAYDLAADPNWRVFVIVIDLAAYGMEGQHYLREPLHQFIDRNLGPRDLFGLVTTEDSWTYLTLGQTASAANAVLDSREWIYGTTALTKGGCSTTSAIWRC